MSMGQIDTLEKINEFLFARKQKGLAPEKIQIYINLLKFFMEHLSKKGLEPVSMDDPVNVVMEVKFDGLDPQTQQEYLQLFLDFVSFCKRGVLPEDEKPEVPASKKPKERKVDTGEKSPDDSIECPKCGKRQKKSDKCIDCGMPMRIFSKSTVNKPQQRKRANIKNLLILLLIIALGALSYYFYYVKMEETSGNYAAYQVIMNKGDLVKYSESMKEYLWDMESVLNSYENLDNDKLSWGDSVEMVLVNLNILQRKIDVAKPPNLFSAMHFELRSKHERLVKELKNIKSDIKAAKAVSGSTGRKARLFNSANMLVQEIEEEREVLHDSLNYACEFNHTDCGL